MINIGIDVHKKSCVVTVKDDTARILEQTEFSNTAGNNSHSGSRSRL